MIGIHGENLSNYRINLGTLFPALAGEMVLPVQGIIVTEELKDEMAEKGYETTLFRPIPAVFSQLLHTPSVTEAEPQVQEEIQPVPPTETTTITDTTEAPEALQAPENLSPRIEPVKTETPIPETKEEQKA